MQLFRFKIRRTTPRRTESYAELHILFVRALNLIRYRSARLLFLTVKTGPSERKQLISEFELSSWVISIIISTFNPLTLILITAVLWICSLHRKNLKSPLRNFRIVVWWILISRAAFLKDKKGSSGDIVLILSLFFSIIWGRAFSFMWEELLFVWYYWCHLQMLEPAVAGLLHLVRNLSLIFSYPWPPIDHRTYKLSLF